jgi:hypothetical protein
MNPELLQARQSVSPDAPGKDTLAQAARLVGEKQWRQADAVLGTLLESYPYHLAARSRRAKVRQRLAEESRLLGVAKVENRNGNLLAAEKSLVELLRDSPHHDEAKELLAAVRNRLAQARDALQKAKEAEKNGRPGMALHLLYVARESWSQGVSANEIERLQNRLRELYPVRISWEARGDGAALVRGALAEKLGTEPIDGKKAAAYQLAVQVVQGPGRVDTVSTERLQHQYATRELQANPELPALRHDADRWEREERAWRHRYEEAVRAKQRAEHHMAPDDPRREQTLRRLAREVDRARDEMQEADRRSDRARRRLRSAPATVMVERTFSLPYVRRTLRKTLTVSAAAVVTFAGQEVTTSTNFSRSGTSQDTVIDGANPSLGLAEDTLSLASDQALAASAGNALGQDVAAWAWQVAWKAWAGQLSASAEDLDRQGKADDAMELRMAAAAYDAQAK